MLKSIFITLPKSPGTVECSNHRTISLMSHVLKILLKIILERIRNKIKPEISDVQYGFVKDKGTRNAIFNVRIISERAIEHQTDMYLCFIDYTKAFDKVRHDKLFQLLKDVNVHGKDLRIL